MKKTTIVFGLVTIIFCLTLFIIIENIKSDLPKIELKEISNWKFDKKNSTNKTTIFNASMIFSNLTHGPIVDFILNNTYGKVKYNNIIIGNVSFNPPSLLKTEPQERRIPLVSKNLTQAIFFEINNTKLTNAIYEHINKNHEIGNLSFSIELNFTINNSFNSLFFEIKQPILNSTIPIKTDILHTIDKKMSQQGIHQGYISHNYSEKIFNFTIYKKKNDNMIYINRTTVLSFHKNSVPFIDINIGDNLKWLSNEESDILKTKNNELNAYMEVIITSGFLGRIIFNNFICDCYNLTANSIPIGGFEIKNMGERNFGPLIRNSNYNFTITMDLTDFNKVIYNHIQNNETTIIKVSPDNGIFPNIPFNQTLSQLLGEVDPKLTIEWTEVKEVITYVQFLLIGIIIGVTATFLNNIYWKRKIKTLK
ncbi:MAG: hypothetical protein MUO82_10030 [Candidatus Thermoplasmatota archaeon]|nr:hypothetical protein [Candidatus Thermoplasmatota archaeon]